MGDPLEIWRAGFVRRWHMNPALSWLDDYTAAHQGRCAALVIALFPDHSHALLRAAVTHDAAELRVGDLARPFKQCGGDLVTAHADLEAAQLADMGLAVDLDAGDMQRLMLVDRLDAFLLVRLRAPHIAAMQEWANEAAAIVALSWSLQVGEKVRDLIAGVDL